MTVGHLRSASDHAEYQELAEDRRKLRDEEGSFFNVSGSGFFVVCFLKGNKHLWYLKESTADQRNWATLS